MINTIKEIKKEFLMYENYYEELKKTEELLEEISELECERYNLTILDKRENDNVIIKFREYQNGYAAIVYKSKIIRNKPEPTGPADYDEEYLEILKRKEK